MVTIIVEVGQVRGRVSLSKLDRGLIMESLRELYRIGTGPSSSHTMGPRHAALVFLERYPDAAAYRVTLYGSLASTGRGHLTDVVLKQVLAGRRLEIIWEPDIVLSYHPNALKLEALGCEGEAVDEWIVYSVGGGKITDGERSLVEQRIYPHTAMSDILKCVRQCGQTLWEYVLEAEPGLISPGA